MNASIRTRLLLSLLTVAVLSAASLSFYFLDELESYGLRKLEERLASEARITAGFAEEIGLADTEALDRALSRIDPVLNARVIVVDMNGMAVADSSGDMNATYGERVEVQNALEGKYGSYTRTSPNGKLALYVALPVRDGDEVIGAAYTSAQTFSILTLLRDYRIRLLWVIGAFAALTLVVAEALARWLSRPLRDLESGANAFAAGQHSVRVRPVGSRETQAVAIAFNQMADEVSRIMIELREEERRKSRFVSDVSHELRTPLTAIRGAAETLLDGDVEPEEADRFLSTMVRESERLGRLANDLLTLQRIEGATGEIMLRRIVLRSVAEHATAALEPLFEEREIDVQIVGEAPDILGDPDRIQQIVANLTDNASRVMEPGGTLTIELSEDKGYAVLAIVDEGPGLADEDLERLFDRFYRADRSRDRLTGGAGLGLAIVKAIVGAHAGDIRAENRVDTHGARFIMRFPAAPE
ncbi:MAG: ATP-binding protein [Actinomycetota bacterium]|jgi:two-component system OmpR family sensor kinase|nr:ATP-binding protein [Actinomycetota bacterium]